MGLSKSGLAFDQDDGKLKALEDCLSVSDILLFRSLAERGLGALERQASCGTAEVRHTDRSGSGLLPQSHLPASAPEGQEKWTSLRHSKSAVPDPRGWMPGLWSFLGYVPLSQAQDSPPLPSDADMEEMYKELHYDPANPAAQTQPRQGGFECDLTIKVGQPDWLQQSPGDQRQGLSCWGTQVSQASLLVASSPAGTGDVALLQAGPLSLSASLMADSTVASLLVGSVAVLDVSSPGLHRPVLCPWQKGERAEPQRGLCRDGNNVVSHCLALLRFRWSLPRERQSSCLRHAQAHKQR